MNPEPTEAAEPAPPPDKVEYPIIADEHFKTAWEMPNLLLSAGEGGILILEGGWKSVDGVTRISYHDAPEEAPERFLIRATNRVKFGGAMVTVINDRIEGDMPLAPTSPTISEYQALRGKEVLVNFFCDPDPHTEKRMGHPVWRSARISIVVP